MEIIRKFLLDGLTTIAESTMERREYIHPKRGGFARDQAKLIGDVRHVGDDVRIVIRKYEQSHKLTCRK